MATAFMRPLRLTTQVLRLVLVSSVLLLLAPFVASADKQPEVFQPVLTGFRCEGFSEVTSEGVLIIEADTQVKLTLFGEYFTTETIVGFTTEFVPSEDVVDQMITSNEANTSTTTQSTPIQTETELEAQATLATPPVTLKKVPEQERVSRVPRSADPDGESPLANVSVRSVQLAAPAPHLFSSPNQVRTELDIKQRKHRRRMLDRRGYDCTDYDRVISYKLAEENIITPNVAVLTIRLPEMGVLSGSGLYYYFCLKQPPIPSDALLRDEFVASETTPNRAPGEQADILLKRDGSTTTPTTTTTSISTVASKGRDAYYLHQINSSDHVWVHQGHEWWLMIRVEPPILSIANDCILIVLLLLLSAVTSGLNLGLMSLDMNELAVISSCGDQRERSYARAIAPLRKRGNYLLCSLLLGNVMVNSTLTVILEEMTSGVVAVIGSTLAIVVLGEIVPQAFCARQGLAIGAKTIYLTYAFMILTFPLSYPISCLLDCVLGAEKGHVYDRERLMEFIRITGNHTQLEADEVAIISGALKLKKIKVDQIMTKLEDVFMLSIDCMLDRKTIRNIIEKGYSRIPVYEMEDRKQIVALILAKDLALLDPDDQMPLASMLMYCKHPLIFIEDTATLDVALNEFKTGKSHMAIVRQIYDDGEVDKYYDTIGVVTLEDVIEEVLQQEINDETDTLSDNRRKRRRADAQVAHLVDELITNSPTKPQLMQPPPPPASPATINLDMMNQFNSKTSNNQSSNQF